MSPTHANGKICYVEIPAVDVQRASAFYAKLFGWAIRARGDGSTAFVDAPEISARFRDPSGNVIGLYQERGIPGREG